MAASERERELIEELCFYTLSHPDPAFIHQHVVDAWAAQQADESTKPITLAFALVGLYLYVEKGFTGHQVQQTHVRLAWKRRQWPRFAPPSERGSVRVADVVAAPPGRERDGMIRRWCESVWDAYAAVHGDVVRLIESELWDA